MLEKTLISKSVFDYPAEQVINPDDQYSPKFGEVQVLIKMLRGEVVGDELKAVLVDGASENKEGIKGTIDTWNDALAYPQIVALTKTFAMQTMRTTLALAHGDRFQDDIVLRGNKLNSWFLTFASVELAS